MVNMNLGERIKQYRLKQLLSQAEFARQAGVTERSVINWEAGRPVSDLSRARLESAFNGIFSESGGSHGKASPTATAFTKFA